VVFRAKKPSGSVPGSTLDKKNPQKTGL